MLLRAHLLVLGFFSCTRAGTGGQEGLSRQTIEWWRWVRISVEDVSNHVSNQPWRSLTNMSGGNNSDSQHQQLQRLRLLADWDPDVIEWYGDYRLNNAEFARARGVVVCHAGEFEYEEGPLVKNLLDEKTPNIVTDIWHDNGLALDINGHPPPSSADGAPPGGISRPYMTHAAPLWHLSVMQGVARQALFADAVVQDNAAGSIGRTYQASGFSPIEIRRFAAYAHMPLNFSIAEYVKGALSRGLRGESLIVDPTVQSYIIWLYVVWRDAWRDIAVLTKQVAQDVGRAPPALYGNIGNDVHPNMAIAESPWHDRCFIENEGWQSFPDHGCTANISGHPYCGFRRADGDPPDFLTTLANKLLQAAAPGKPTISYGYPSNVATLALWLGETSAINSVAGQQDYQLADRTDEECPVQSCAGMQQFSNLHVRFTQMNRHLLEDRQRIADTAVVYCYACVMWRQVHAVISDGVSVSHMLYFKAVSTVMERTHRAWEPYLLPYEGVWSRPVNSSNAPLARSLASYSQVILPAVDALSDRDVAELSAFVRNGGHLVLVNNNGDVPETGLKNENLQPREVPALQALQHSPGVGRIDKIDTSTFSQYVDGGTGAFAKVSALFNDVSSPTASASAVSLQGAPPSLFMNAYSHGGGGSMLTVHLVNYSLAHHATLPLDSHIADPATPVVLTLRETFATAWWFTVAQPHGQLLNTSPTESGGTSMSLPQVPVYAIVALGTQDQIQLRATAAEARKWLQRLLIAHRSYALQAHSHINVTSSAQLLQQVDALLLTVQGGEAIAITDAEASRLTLKLQTLTVQLKQALSTATKDVATIQAALRAEHTADLCTTEAHCVVGINFCGNTACEGAASPGFQDVVMNNMSYLPRRGVGFTSSKNGISVLISDTDTEPADSLHRTAWKGSTPATYQIDLPGPGPYVVTVMSGSQDLSGNHHLGSSYAGNAEANSQWMVFSSTAVHVIENGSARGGILAAQGLPSGYFACRSFAINASSSSVTLSIGSRAGGATGLNYGANAVLWMLNALTVHRAGGAPLPRVIQAGLNHSERLRHLVCRDFWWVGAFDASVGLGLETTYPPEQMVPSAASLPTQTFTGKNKRRLRWQRWQAGTTAPVALDFGRLLGNLSVSGAVAFAWTQVFLNNSQRVNIWASASGAARIWTVSQHPSPAKRLVWSGALITGMDDAASRGPVAHNVLFPAGSTVLLMKSVHTFNGDYNIGKGDVGTGPAEWAAWLGIELSEPAHNGSGGGAAVTCTGDLHG